MEREEKREEKELISLYYLNELYVKIETKMLDKL